MCALSVIVSAASTIAVAVVAVVMVLACVTFNSRAVAFASTRATRSWFFDAVVSKSHFALLAIAFDVVFIWGMVGSGSPPWLEAAKSWYCCLGGIRHSCCQFGSVR